MCELCEPLSGPPPPRARTTQQEKPLPGRSRLLRAVEQAHRSVPRRLMQRLNDTGRVVSGLYLESRVWPMLAVAPSASERVPAEAEATHSAHMAYMLQIWRKSFLV